MRVVGLRSGVSFLSVKKCFILQVIWHSVIILLYSVSLTDKD